MALGGAPDSLLCPPVSPQPPKKGGSKKKEGDKKEEADGAAPQVTVESLSQRVGELEQELEHERMERNYYQLERVRTALFPRSCHLWHAHRLVASARRTK